MNQTTKTKSCQTCKWRTGTRCRKIKEYIGMGDWCSAYKSNPRKDQQMGKVKEFYLIELKEKEAEALKIILDKITDEQKKEWGLDQNDIEDMLDLSESLPNRR